MTVRPFAEGDYAALEALGGYAAKYAANVRRWLAKGWAAPEGCFVFKGAGGVCFAEDGADLEILDFAVLDERANEGAALLRSALEAGAAGRKVAYNLYNDTPQYEAIKRIFAECGFVTAQEKFAYVYEGGDGAPPDAAGLTFRSFAEVGEAAFVDAVRRVTVGTLDGLMAKEAAELGGAAAARAYADSLKALDFRPSWWRLAYDAGGLVGLILPQAFNADVGAINYIGVVPERRGEGLGLALLADGTRALAEFGIKRIHADIDRANKPLARQLERAGYAFKHEEAVLERPAQTA